MAKINIKFFDLIVNEIFCLILSFLTKAAKGSLIKEERAECGQGAQKKEGPDRKEGTLTIGS